MAKKWQARGTHALSSGVAVVTLVGAGIAAASQGGMRAMESEPARGMENRPAFAHAPDSRSSSSRDVASGTAATELSPESCASASVSVELSMPKAQDLAGVEHAIDVVSAICGDAWRAKGLLTALERLAAHDEGRAHADGARAHGKGDPGKGDPGKGDPGKGDPGKQSITHAGGGPAGGPDGHDGSPSDGDGSSPSGNGSSVSAEHGAGHP